MSSPWVDDAQRMSTALSLSSHDLVTLESYRESTAPAQQRIVFGLQAWASGIVVPNDEVAEFARLVGGDTVGFMSVDPTRHDAIAEIDRSHSDLQLKGIKLGPIYQGTSPLDPRAIRVFAKAERLGLPIMIHQGAIFAKAGRLCDASPLLLDDVATAFPDLRIVIAHMGHPWVFETVTVMRRHNNVYADTSAIPNRPSMLAMALGAAKEYGVLDKVLFGSDSPMVSVQSAIDALRDVQQEMSRSGHVRITEEEIEGILHRPSFELLGLA